MEDPCPRKSHAMHMRVDDIRYPYSLLISDDCDENVSSRSYFH